MTRQQGAKDLQLVLTALGIEHLPRHCRMSCVKTVVEALQYQGAPVDRVIDRSRRHIEKGQGNRHAYVSQDSRQCILDTYGITRPAVWPGGVPAMQKARAGVPITQALRAPAIQRSYTRSE